jgi:hypothetical protein
LEKPLAVFVLDTQGQALMPCTEKRARLLLARGRARVHRLVREPLKTTVFIQCPAVFARNFRVCPFFEQIALFSGLFVPHSSRIGPLQAYLGL